MYSYAIRGCPEENGLTESVNGSADFPFQFHIGLTELEENADFFISIVARNEAGDSEPTNITSTTLVAGILILSIPLHVIDNVNHGMPISHHAAPSSPPTDLQVSSTSHTSITFTWGRVPCVDRNVEVNQYHVRYGPAGTFLGGGNVITNISRRIFTLLDLIPRTNYTIEVVAAHVDFSAIPPVVFNGPAGTVVAITETSPGTYIVMPYVFVR